MGWAQPFPLSSLSYYIFCQLKKGVSIGAGKPECLRVQCPALCDAINDEGEEPPVDPPCFCAVIGTPILLDAGDLPVFLYCQLDNLIILPSVYLTLNEWNIENFCSLIKQFQKKSLIKKAKGNYRKYDYQSVLSTWTIGFSFVFLHRFSSRCSAILKKICFGCDPHHDHGPQAGQNKDIGSSCNKLVITGVINDSTTDTTSLNDSGT